jgi:ArsR family metal-binding transcriptional regulator
MAEELIRGYDLKLVTPDCLPNAEHYRADVALRDDIAEALPFLNAAFDGGDYSHEAKVLLWNSGGKRYAFRPRVISIAPVADREEADALARAILHTVNGIWERRGALQPKFEGKKPLPGVLEIYKTLPRTNCKACGYPSCMAFASALRSDSEKAALCPFLPTNT